MHNTAKVLSAKLDWASFEHVRKRIFTLFGERWDPIVIDLSDCKVIYPNGIVPLIALIDAFRARRQFEVIVVPPDDQKALRFCQKYNWLYYLDPKNFEPGSDAEHSLALRKFEGEEEANELVTRVLEVTTQQLQFEAGAETAFQWAISEMTGNVLEHSGSAGWMQVMTYPEARRLALVVCDAGVGVCATMRRAFTSIRNDRDVVMKALEPGVTSTPSGQGQGLAGCVAIAEASDGRFALTSGQGRVEVLSNEVLASDFIPPLIGTCVELQLPTDFALDLRTVLGHEPTSRAEIRHMDESGWLVVRLADYAKVFGNRPTGSRIRNAVINMLRSNPTSPVEIKMDDVSIFSSSFADELFGKLAVELGVLEFGKRVRCTGLNEVCSSLLETAIQTRFGQVIEERQSRRKKMPKATEIVENPSPNGTRMLPLLLEMSAEEHSRLLEAARRKGMSFEEFCRIAIAQAAE